MRPAPWLLVVAGALGLACEIDGSLGRVGSTDAATEAGTVDDGPTDSAADATEGGTAEGGGTAVASASGGGTGGDSTAGPTDRPAVCHPTPDDGECARCRKDSCCAPYEACLAHDSCLCWWDCLATDHTTEECGMACETDGALYAELHTCVTSHCDALCPQ